VCYGPRRTERHYWSVSCLPSTPGKALVRVNASWMELFSLYADDEGIRALFLVHLSDFTTDHSLDQGQVDEAFLERCVTSAGCNCERSPAKGRVANTDVGRSGAR
jgi:hypothetical protein